MNIVESLSEYRDGLAVLLDVSGCDEEIVLRDNCHVMIVPMAPSSVSGIEGSALIEAMPGSVVFLPAGTTPAVNFRESFDTLILLVCQNKESRQRPPNRLTNHPLPDEVMLVTSPQSIGAIAQIARRIGSVGRGFSPDCIDAVAQLLLSEIILQSRSRLNPAGKSRRLLDGGSIRAIDQYLDDHLEDPLSLNDLADYAAMTRHQFSRRFKNATGVSPFQYVIAKRVKRARDLLARGKESIAEVAYATGFSSQSHLTETFKRHFGVTPGAYKRAHNHGLTVAP